MTQRLLFCLKYREALWGAVGSELSSGLLNSVTFLVNMLNDNGIEAKLVQLTDNNAIDREIHAYKPTTVVLEALWVTPAKVATLQRLHRSVHFCVRVHSDVPFLSLEGMSIEWLHDLMMQSVEIMCNSPRAVRDVANMAKTFGHKTLKWDHLVTYFPNYYPLDGAREPMWERPTDGPVKVICAGSIRPLKNHLMQALAALEYAGFANRPLNFYVNTTRIENNAAPILKNLRALFANARDAKLVELPWLEHTEFLALMATMDISMQVSFSETFNIVSADAVHQGVVAVASNEVPWLGEYAQANPVDCQSIVTNLIHAQQSRTQRLKMQLDDLWDYCAFSAAIWVERFGV
jgi:hypothetical protein